MESEQKGNPICGHVANRGQWKIIRGEVSLVWCESKLLIQDTCTFQSVFQSLGCRCGSNGVSSVFVVGRREGTWVWG